MPLFSGPTVPFELESAVAHLGYPFASDRDGSIVEWHALTHGKAGILITGDAGTGKTNTAHIFAASALVQGDQVFAFAGGPYGAREYGFLGGNLATNLYGAAEVLNRVHEIVRSNDGAEHLNRAVLIVEDIFHVLRPESLPALPNADASHDIGQVELERGEIRARNELRRELFRSLSRIARAGQESGVVLVLTAARTLDSVSFHQETEDILENVAVLAFAGQSYEQLHRVLGDGAKLALSADEPKLCGLFNAGDGRTLPVRVHQFHLDGLLLPA